MGREGWNTDLVFFARVLKSPCRAYGALVFLASLPSAYALG